ncbi:DNA-binding protein [Brachybacterium sp. MASK1Z-5]|uniref:DNA-binding protein n=2 Tax=Brachybacterium halotolerans TaxID=2795215 RepID=A0ABS1B653_9MICO|nr:DNA-binding protein [Brachybacterium halotolerans]
MIGSTAGTLRTWRCDGKADAPPFLKVGRSVRYRESALIAWMDKLEGGDAA